MMSRSKITPIPCKPQLVDEKTNVSHALVEEMEYHLSHHIVTSLQRIRKAFILLALYLCVYSFPSLSIIGREYAFELSHRLAKAGPGKLDIFLRVKPITNRTCETSYIQL